MTHRSKDCVDSRSSNQQMDETIRNDTEKASWCNDDNEYFLKEMLARIRDTQESVTSAIDLSSCCTGRMDMTRYALRTCSGYLNTREMKSAFFIGKCL